jgi:hypothetical protein
VYVLSGKSTRIHAYALVYGEGGRITTKPTLVGHIRPDIIIFTKKLLGCVMINKTLHTIKSKSPIKQFPKIKPTLPEVLLNKAKP